MQRSSLPAMIMNSRKQLLIAFALIAFFSVSACRKNSAPNEPIAASQPEAAERQHPEGGVAAIVQSKFFKGSIGGASDLQMKLVREGEKLTGSYSYQKIGKKIDVRGNVDKDGNMTLEEFDTSGKQSGLFQGLWKQNQDGLSYREIGRSPAATRRPRFHCMSSRLSLATAWRSSPGRSGRSIRN
jgi:hypothetical protein